MTKEEQKIHNILFGQKVSLKSLVDKIYLENYDYINIDKRGSFICVRMFYHVKKSTFITYYDFDSVTKMLVKISRLWGATQGYQKFELLYNKEQEYKWLIGTDWYKAYKARKIIRDANTRITEI